VALLRWTASMKTLISGAKYSPTFIMAHGAGAPMDSDWMNSVAKGISSHHIRVVRFEFPYMQERRISGTKRPPNSKSILIQAWDQIIERELAKGHQVYIGGKSMGGRIASMVADQHDVSGCIVLGFPFHAPGKAPGDRILHLAKLKTPSVIIQGTRDTMGSQQECSLYDLSKKIRFHWLEDGDHSFKPRKKSGLTQEEHIESAINAIVHFIKGSQVPERY
jgi:predicted alpha/beta-hydrolase family hydrolase